MTKPHTPPVYLDIVEEHFDELDFLWEVREANVFAPDWTSAELTTHEARAFAHLDGLLVGGDAAFALARERILGGETSAATAATFVLCASDARQDFDAIVAALRSEDVAIVDGVRTALRHRPIERFVTTLKELAVGDAPFAAAAAADVLAFHGLDVPGLKQLLRLGDPLALRWVLGAVGRRAVLTDADLRDLLAHAEPDVRRAALEAAVRSGVPTVPALRAIIATPGDVVDRVAFVFLAIVGGTEDVALLAQQLGREPARAAAIEALGVAGVVDHLPALCAHAVGAMAPIAWAAYRRVTGAVEIAGKALVAAPEPAADEPPQGPSAAELSQDWERRAHGLARGARMQSGMAVEDADRSAPSDKHPLAVRRDLHLRVWSLGARRGVELERTSIHGA